MYIIDFTSATQVNHSDTGLTSHYTHATAISDTEAIYGGYDTSSTPHKLVFLRMDPNAGTLTWGMQTNTFENIYGTSAANRRMYAYLNSDSTKYVSITALSSAALIVIMNPTNGNLIDARQIAFSTSFSSMELYANGRVSNDMIVVSMTTSSEDSSLMSFVNITSWESTAYKASANVQMVGFTPIFDTNQIVLLMRDSSKYWSLKTGYDQMNYTEVFKGTTDTITDANSSLSFSSVTVTLSSTFEPLDDVTITTSNETLQTISDLTYKVTANIFSTSTQSFSGTSDDTFLGSAYFDCYDIVTNANNVSFADQLSIAQTDGQAGPSWMSVDSASGNISFSNAEAVSSAYLIQNSYTGSVENFTLDITVFVDITCTGTSNMTSNNTNGDENDEDHCFNALSRAL